MRIRVVVLTTLIACFLMVTSALAQDPLSGTWTGTWGPNAYDRNDVTVMLKWDGKALTGNVNPGQNVIALLKTAFDAKTGSIHMEADAPGRGGERIRYVIDGKVDKGAITGTWNHDNRKGDFKITKQ